MPTPLEEIAGVPKAPHPPDIEDVLGPPPHAPRIGRGGPIGTGRRGRTRPPSPPHLAKPSQPQVQPVKETIIREVKPEPYKPPVAKPDERKPGEKRYRPPRGIGGPGYEAKREARKQAAEDVRNAAQGYKSRNAGAHASPQVASKLVRTDLGEGDVENATKGAYEKLKPESEAVSEGFVQPNEPAGREATP